MNGREKAFAEISRRKKTAEAKFFNTLEELRKDEEFDDLFRRENSLKWDYVRTKTDAEKMAIDELINKNKLAINQYLTKKGLPDDTLKIKYFCKNCNDSGQVDGNPCQCLENARIKFELEENPILKDAADSLDEIDFDFYGADADLKKQYAKYIEKVLEEKQKAFFLLAGKAGTAKTYLAATALKQALLQGKSVSAVNSINLNKKFLEYHCAYLSNKEYLWKNFIEPDIMLIDDLGVEQILNKVTIPYLYELLVERMEKVTFVTTNLDVDGIEARYGQRILSRLLDKKLSTAIIVKGKDLRFN